MSHKNQPFFQAPSERNQAKLLGDLLARARRPGKPVWVHVRDPKTGRPAGRGVIVFRGGRPAVSLRKGPTVPLTASLLWPNVKPYAVKNCKCSRCEKVRAQEAERESA